MIRAGATRIVVSTGLTVGAIDCLFASARTFTFGRSVTKLWQFVASGLLGQQAFSMGLGGAFTGILCHFLIMIIFAALIYTAYLTMPFIRRHPILTGPLYGLFMWVAMSFVVVPYSKAGTGAVSLDRDTLNGMIFSINLLVHVFLGTLLTLITSQWLQGAMAASPNRPSTT